MDEKVKAAEENLAPLVAGAAEAAAAAAVSAEPVPEPAQNAGVRRARNKPVPVIKNEKPVIPVIPDTEEEEDINDDYMEDEWEDFDDSEAGDDEMPDGPEISFNPHSPGSRNSNDRILELHKEGKSNMAIAKELGLGIGEVKLVIDLFKGQ